MNTKPNTCSVLPAALVKKLTKKIFEKGLTTF